MNILTGQAITAELNPAALGLQFGTVPAGNYTIGAKNDSCTLPLQQVQVANPFEVATTQVTNHVFAEGLEQLEGRDTVLIALLPGDRVKLLARGTKADVEGMTMADVRGVVEASVVVTDLRRMESGFRTFNFDSQILGLEPVTLVHRLDEMREAFRGGKKPVIEVTWFESAAFLALFGLRLPTEIEHEIAARGSRGLEYGTSTGELYDAQGRRLAHFQERSTADVGSYPANEFGLYDMAGNVREWASSLCREGDPYRVVRGGSWYDNAQGLRAAYRDYYDPGLRRFVIGFRAVAAPRTPEV